MTQPQSENKTTPEFIYIVVVPFFIGLGLTYGAVFALGWSAKLINIIPALLPGAVSLFVSGLRFQNHKWLPAVGYTITGLAGLGMMGYGVATCMEFPDWSAIIFALIPALIIWGILFVLNRRIDGQKSEGDNTGTTVIERDTHVGDTHLQYPETPKGEFVLSEYRNEMRETFDIRRLSELRESFAQIRETARELLDLNKINVDQYAKVLMQHTGLDRLFEKDKPAQPKPRERRPGQGHEDFNPRG